MSILSKKLNTAKKFRYADLNQTDYRRISLELRDRDASLQV